MGKETLTTRVARLETTGADLNAKMAVLVDAQIKTEQQFQETERHLRELGEETDRRIRDLVSAIGEFLRRNGK